MTKPISNPSKRQEAPRFPATPRRKALLARVHALAKELGLEGPHRKALPRPHDRG